MSLFDRHDVLAERKERHLDQLDIPEAKRDADDGETQQESGDKGNNAKTAIRSAANPNGIVMIRTKLTKAAAR